LPVLFGARLSGVSHKELFMKRRATLATLAVLGLTSLVGAAQLIPIDDLRNKATLTDADRQLMRQWIVQVVDQMVTNTDADRRGMVAARESLVAEGREQTGHSPAYVQAFGELAIAALTEAEKNVSPDFRLNLFMAVAELRRPEGAPMLTTALLKERYATTRYWGAKGMEMMADTVVAKSLGAVEKTLVEAAEKAFQDEMPVPQATALLSMLGRFDGEKAHDVFADAVIRFVLRNSPADQAVGQSLLQVLNNLERVYVREVRPETKEHLLTAYATLCSQIMPPTGVPSLMVDLNASLEKILPGEKVGFLANTDPVMQKLALLEWVEKFLRDKKISKRPALPAMVEDIVKEVKEGGGAVAPVAPAPGAVPAPGPAVGPIVPPPPVK
jgi:hypothetical protein